MSYDVTAKQKWKDDALQWKYLEGGGAEDVMTLQQLG